MTERKRLADLGEFGLIEQIQRQAGSAPYLRLGIGDDCSIQSIEKDEELLTSTDLLIEGVHFNLDWCDFRQLGRKCIAVNVSDIAAMGGTPRSLYLGVAVPRSVSAEDLEHFIEGVLLETDRYGAVLAGGDTSRSSGPLIISVTVQGTARREQAVCRSGAANGDRIYVSGTLGDSALALKQLMNGEAVFPELAARHHTPQARTELGQRLAERGLATAMIDVSDGLLADLQHILDDSSKGAFLELERIPLSPRFVECCQETPELIDLALTGGEDYELLFTASPDSDRAIVALSTELNLPLTRIGEVHDRAELVVRRRDGSDYPYRRGGFDHFA